MVTYIIIEADACIMQRHKTWAVALIKEDTLKIGLSRGINQEDIKKLFYFCSNLENTLLLEA